MIYLANCSRSEAAELKGTLFEIEERVSAKTKNITRRKHRVLVNVETKNIVSALEDGLGNAQMVTTSKTVPYCPGGMQGRVFQRVPLDELDMLGKVPTGVVILVEMPDGFSDMREALRICRELPEARLIGGKLLGIEGVRIGRFDEGDLEGVKFTDKRVFFEGSYDPFVEVDLMDLENIETDAPKTGAIRVKREKVAKAPREPKAPSEPKEPRAPRVTVPKALSKTEKKRQTVADLFG